MYTVYMSMFLQNAQQLFLFPSSSKSSTAKTLRKLWFIFLIYYFQPQLMKVFLNNLNLERCRCGRGRPLHLQWQYPLVQATRIYSLVSVMRRIHVNETLTFVYLKLLITSVSYQQHKPHHIYYLGLWWGSNPGPINCLPIVLPLYILTLPLAKVLLSSWTQGSLIMNPLI